MQGKDRRIYCYQFKQKQTKEPKMTNETMTATDYSCVNYPVYNPYFYKFINDKLTRIKASESPRYLIDCLLAPSNMYQSSNTYCLAKQIAENTTDIFVKIGICHALLYCQTQDKEHKKQAEKFRDKYFKNYI
jgi:hypothetical protein